MSLSANEMNAQIVPIPSQIEQTYYQQHPVSNRCSSFGTDNILSTSLFDHVNEFHVEVNQTGTFIFLCSQRSD